MNYKVIDPEKYYRKGVYRHFTEHMRDNSFLTSPFGAFILILMKISRTTKF